MAFLSYIPSNQPRRQSVKESGEEEKLKIFQIYEDLVKIELSQYLAQNII
jgi:hypothetical protein